MGKLTKRESQVFRLILDGDSHKEIGNALKISHRTVEIHISNIFTKFKVNSKIDLIRKYNYLRNNFTILQLKKLLSFDDIDEMKEELKTIIQDMEGD